MAALRPLRLYVDESGDFGSVATHVVCAVVVPSSVDAAEERFAALWTELGLGWRAFHATDHSPEQIARYVAHFRERLAPLKVGIVLAWHQNRRRYDCTFYFPLVARAMVAGWEHALPDLLEVRPAPSTINCVATLEMRTTMNATPLCKRVHASCRTVTRQRGGGFGTDIRISLVEKGASPLVQIADLFANAFYRARNGGDTTLAAALEGLPIHEAGEDWICAPGQVQLERDVLGAAAVSEPTAAPTVARAIDHLRAEVIVDRARAAAKKGKRLTPSDCRAAVVDLLQESPGARAAQIALLLDTVPRLVDDERDYDLGEAIVDLTDHLVAEERKRTEQAGDLLDEWTTRATANWVLVMNHLGRACAREPRVEEALALARRLQRDPRHWQTTATLTNYVSVNFHNALDFEEAERLLGPHVDYYLDVLRAPPGADLRAPWIGALLGTHAQTKAFWAHGCYFADRGASLRPGLAQAREYSEYATLHFTAREDDLRHSTYQAHMFMQEAMLLGDAVALAAAGERLAAEMTPEEAVAEFLDQFPAPAAVTRAYRVSALLKHAWLGKTRPTWWATLSAGVLQAVHAVTEQHPYQQLIGYLALLSDGPARARYRKALRETDWRGLVGLIARCFDAQLDYDEAGVVTPERLEALRVASRASLPPRWLSGQLQDELTRFGAAHTGRAPGPLVLLPFNFC